MLCLKGICHFKSVILTAKHFPDTLLTKVCIVKAMVFQVVMYGCESWTIKNAECLRIDALNYDAGEDSWESLGQQGDKTSQS